MKQQKVRELMHTEPVVLDAACTGYDAAVKMNDADIGDVLVTEDGRLCGILTDRDLVVRCMASGRDPKTVRIGELCSSDLDTLEPDADAEAAVRLMREKAVRRIPVVESDRAVGILSIGDLAQRRDPRSTLSEISAAPANN